jgi:hypothetical protein
VFVTFPQFTTELLQKCQEIFGEMTETGVEMMFIIYQSFKTKQIRKCGSVSFNKLKMKLTKDK